MGTMKDHVHMRIAKTLTTISGIWPVKLTGYKLKLYNAYFYISFTYYILFDVSVAILPFAGGESDLMEIADNLSLLLVYVVNIYKAYISRSDTVRKIIQEIEIKEKIILENADEKIKEIYYKQAKSTKLYAYLNVAFGSTSIGLYFITPILKNMMEKKNEFGVKNKHFIFSSWFPFDPYENYALAYIIHFFGGCYGYFYIVYSGTFFFSMLKFCIGQIQILQHIFRNLNHYMRQFSMGNHLAEGESYEMIYTKLCIREHQYIISLVERFDNSIKTFMLLEFMISSLQLTFLVLQFLQSTGFGIQHIAILSFIGTLVSQLFLFYWNADEITIQSAEIAQSVYQCDWSNLDPKVQKMLILIMKRAQKPMAISIGPIYQVKVDSLIAIFKAIYSYVAVMQK